MTIKELIELAEELNMDPAKMVKEYHMEKDSYITLREAQYLVSIHQEQDNE